VALLADPPVLLDEPTANLDAKARRDYLACSPRSAENKT
jgi:ABC-type multidrug transport system ATPase subunit